jgi:hypothetical protein
VCHTIGLAIYIKTYLKAKKRIMETQIYFTIQKYNLQKNPLKKKTKILQDIITNLKVSTQEAKISSFKKSSYKNK